MVILVWDTAYLHPYLHGVQHECGEGGVEIHFESKGLRADERKGVEVVATGTQEETVVTECTLPSTLHREWAVCVVMWWCVCVCGGGSECCVCV